MDLGCMTKMFKVSLKQCLLTGSLSPVNVVDYKVLELLRITFLTSLVKMMVLNQELIAFPASSVKMMILNQELILMMMTLVSSTGTMTKKTKLCTILIN